MPGTMRSIVRAVCELDYPVRGAVLAPPARGHVSAPVHGDLADRPVHAQRALQGLVDQIPASQVPSDQVGCRVREMTGQPVHVHAAGGAHEDAGPDQPVQRIVERSLASLWNSLRRSRLRYTYLPVTSHRLSTLIASLCLMPHKCTRTVQNTLFAYTYGVGVEFAGLGPDFRTQIRNSAVCRYDVSGTTLPPSTGSRFTPVRTPVSVQRCPLCRYCVVYRRPRRLVLIFPGSFLVF